VNIAASQAGDGTFGLFVERTGYKVGRKYFETSGGDIYELIPKHMAETFLVGSPLSKRAWAFQERYLAQRTLHFTAEQIFAECNQHIACEAWPRGVPETWEHREFPKFPKGLHKKDWTRTVYHYLEGQLTYPKDILVALSGVARQFQERLQDQYVAGLWIKQFAVATMLEIKAFQSVQPPINLEIAIQGTFLVLGVHLWTYYMEALDDK
jgi:hypothetical protein